MCLIDKQIIMKKLSVNNKIDKLNCTLGDFWSWAYSDVLNNRNRGIFAEFMVVKLLGAKDETRIEWDNCDVEYDKKNIEVKCSSSIQSWDQDKYSNIIFNISEKHVWDKSSDKRTSTKRRYSDLYIFCLLKEKDYKIIEVLDLDQWEFFVIGTDILNNTFHEQKTLSLNKIKKITNSVSYRDLKKEVDKLII